MVEPDSVTRQRRATTAHLIPVTSLSVATPANRKLALDGSRNGFEARRQRASRLNRRYRRVTVVTLDS
jgi:hypothetical protein